SYAESTVLLLQRRGLLQRPCVARALAITPNGLESLAARFTLEGEPEPRCALMSQLGEAYRETAKISDGDASGLDTQIGRVFKGVVNKLPVNLRDGMKKLRAMPQPGEDYIFEFEEAVPDFSNPTDNFTIDEALA